MHYRVLPTASMPVMEIVYWILLGATGSGKWNVPVSFIKQKTEYRILK